MNKKMSINKWRISLHFKTIGGALKSIIIYKQCTHTTFFTSYWILENIKVNCIPAAIKINVISSVFLFAEHYESDAVPDFVPDFKDQLHGEFVWVFILLMLNFEIIYSHVNWKCFREGEAIWWHRGEIVHVRHLTYWEI